MSLVIVEGFETGNGGPYVTQSGGTFSYQSTTKRSGTYALRSNPTTTGHGWVAFGTVNGGVLALATMYSLFYFRADTLPSADYESLARITDASDVLKLNITITSGGLIAVRDKDNSLVATGTTVLSTGTFYGIHVKASNGTSGAYEIKINGTVELTGTCNQLAVNCAEIFLGKTNYNGNSVDFYYDDLQVDNSAYPTLASILLIKANADGSTQQWTSGTNASDWNEVDEIPYDGGVTYVKCGTGGNQVALFGMQSCSDVGLDGTILALQAQIRCREDTSVVSANKIRVRSGGNNYDGTAANFSTTLLWNALIHETDPNTSAAWTTAAINAVEIGSIETNAVSMRLDSVSAQIAYVPAAAVVPSGAGLGTGVTVGISPTGIDFPYGRG